MPPDDLLRKEDRRAVTRERHGLFRCGTFAAARVRRPSIQNIRERYSDHVPRARILGRLTSSRLVSSARHALAVRPDPHFARQCDPFATYRQVNRPPASMICRCITGHDHRWLEIESKGNGYE